MVNNSLSQNYFNIQIHSFDMHKLQNIVLP